MKKKILITLMALSIILFLGYFLIKNNDNISKKQICFKSKNVQVTGKSMLPLLKDREVIQLLEGYYNCNKIEKGHVIAFSFPAFDKTIIKKVVAVSGDKVSFNNGHLHINNIALKNSEGSPYILHKTEQKWFLKATTDNKVKAHKFLVLSENTSSKYDSRRFGAVFRNQIIGRVLSPILLKNSN